MKVVFDKLMKLLFNESCKVLETPITLQLDWVEQKCFEIRRSACESKICLKELKELSAQVVIDKVFFSYQGESDRKFFDLDLVSALNYESLLDMSLKVSLFSQDKTGNEFIVMDTAEMFTEEGLRKVEECEVVLTNANLNLEEYLDFLEKQERKHKNITERAILVIDNEDFDFLISKLKTGDLDLGIAIPNEGGLTKAEQIAKWTGFPVDKVDKILKKMESEFQLTNKLVGLIKEEEKRKAEEEKKKQEEEKKGEGKEDPKEEKVDTGPKELTEEEKLALEAAKKERKAQREKDPEYVRKKKEYIENKEREELNSKVMEMVYADVAQQVKMELKERKKLENQTSDALIKQIKGFTEATAQ